MEWGTILPLAIGTIVVLFPVAFIWYINVGGIYAAIKRRRVAKLVEKAIPNLTCTIDAECPQGYVCLTGYCVPQKA